MILRCRDHQIKRLQAEIIRPGLMLLETSSFDGTVESFHRFAFPLRDHGHYSRF